MKFLYWILVRKVYQALLCGLNVFKKSSIKPSVKMRHLKLLLYNGSLYFNIFLYHINKIYNVSYYESNLYYGIGVPSP